MRSPLPFAFAERTARIQRALSTMARLFTLSPALLLSLTLLVIFIFHYLHHLLPSQGIRLFRIHSIQSFELGLFFGSKVGILAHAKPHQPKLVCKVVFRVLAGGLAWLGSSDRRLQDVL